MTTRIRPFRGRMTTRQSQVAVDEATIKAVPTVSLDSGTFEPAIIQVKDCNSLEKPPTAASSATPQRWASSSTARSSSPGSNPPTRETRKKALFRTFLSGVRLWVAGVPRSAFAWPMRSGEGRAR